ncbi:MAG: acyl carrier protein [Paludibacteraceae bacterium]|jgi:acyl carrier protein
MDKNIFIENVKNQFENYQDITLNMESNFREVDTYDSLTAMAIMVMLKDEYNVDISDEEYLSKKTVQELYDFVQLNQ